MLFGRKEKAAPEFHYDPEKHRAVLKCNTCNRDRVFGFRDTETGEFHEVVMIREEAELAALMKKYRLSDVEKRY